MQVLQESRRMTTSVFASLHIQQSWVCLRAVARGMVMGLLALLWPLLAQAQSVGVSEGGTASYSFPISVPPGIAGMSPNIGLLYSGNGVNGPVGHGWSIQGISMITRCPYTKAIDGEVHGVIYSSNDKLCLDGQRLIQSDANGVVINGNVVNPSSTNRFQLNDSQGLSIGYREFRTEKDSFVRVRAYGMAGGVNTNGPAYFKVWTKSGQIYEYGNNANASANAAITTKDGQVAVWAVSRISDTLGNYIDFQYDQRKIVWGSASSVDTNPGLGSEWNLLEIRYTGTPTQGPFNKVVFEYEDRPSFGGGIQDRAEAYRVGSKELSVSRLKAVRTFVRSTGTALGAGVGAIKVKTTKLIYENGPITNRSRVAKIVECMAESELACLPATTFVYATGGGEAYRASAAFNASALSTLPMLSMAGNLGVIPADFNGDGKTDILRWSDNPADNQLYLSTANDGEFALASNFNITDQNLFKSDGCYAAVVVDLNGDGLPDILRYSAPTSPKGVACAAYGPVYAYINSGNGSFVRQPYIGPTLATTIGNFTCTTTVITTCSISPHGASFFLIDVDGDGRADIVTSELHIWTSTRLIPIPKIDKCPLGICTHVYHGNGDGSFSEIPISFSFASRSVFVQPRGTGPSRQVVDWNRDGLADFIKPPDDFSDSWSVFSSSGDGNFNKATIQPCPVLIDFNGDGLNDCLAPSTTVAANALQSTGGVSLSLKVDGFNLVNLGQELDGPGVGVVIADVNEDGRQDIIRWKDDPTQNTVYLSNGDGTFSRSPRFNLNTAAYQLKKSDGTADSLTADFTGHGNTEILRLRASPTAGAATSNQLFIKADPTPPDQLVSVTSPSGLTTTLTWVTLPNSVAGGVARYTSDRGTANAAVYPNVDVVAPLSVVATSVTDTGVGSSQVTTEYSYAGLKGARDGREAQGFRETRRQSPGADGSPTTVVTQYLQTHPYIGVAVQSETRLGTLNATSPRVIRRSSYIYCDKTAALGAEAVATSAAPCPTTAKVQRPYLYKSIERDWELNGAGMPLVTTTHAFNDTGDPTQIRVTTDGTAVGVTKLFNKLTTNTYWPDNTTCSSDNMTCNWILGRLRRTTQHNVSPSSLASTTTSAGTAPNAAATRGSGTLPPPIP